MCMDLYLYHRCTHQTYDTIHPCAEAIQRSTRNGKYEHPPQICLRGQHQSVRVKTLCENCQASIENYGLTKDFLEANGMSIDETEDPEVTRARGFIVEEKPAPKKQVQSKRIGTLEDSSNRGKGKEVQDVSMADDSDRDTISAPSSPDCVVLSPNTPRHKQVPLARGTMPTVPSKTARKRVASEIDVDSGPTSHPKTGPKILSTGIRLFPANRNMAAKSRSGLPLTLRASTSKGSLPRGPGLPPVGIFHPSRAGLALKRTDEPSNDEKFVDSITKLKPSAPLAIVPAQHNIVFKPIQQGPSNLSQQRGTTSAIGSSSKTAPLSKPVSKSLVRGKPIPVVDRSPDFPALFPQTDPSISSAYSAFPGSEWAVPRHTLLPALPVYDFLGRAAASDLALPSPGPERDRASQRPKPVKVPAFGVARDSITLSPSTAPKDPSAGPSLRRIGLINETWKFPKSGAAPEAPNSDNFSLRNDSGGSSGHGPRATTPPSPTPGGNQINERGTVRPRVIEAQKMWNNPDDVWTHVRLDLKDVVMYGPTTARSMALVRQDEVWSTFREYMRQAVDSADNSSNREVQQQQG